MLRELKEEVGGFGGIQRIEASFLSQSFLSLFSFSVQCFTFLINGLTVHLDPIWVNEVTVGVCECVNSIETYCINQYV